MNPPVTTPSQSPARGALRLGLNLQPPASALGAIVLLGPPSAGRSACAEPLARLLGLPLVPARALLERAAQEAGPLSHLLRFYVEAGAPAPAALSMGVLSPRLPVDGAMVLDGYPVCLEQAEALDAWLERHGAAPARAVKLDLHENAALMRLSGRRLCRRCPDEHYNVFDRQPVIDGRCDRCLSPLRQRVRDKPDMVLRRLHKRAAQERPMERHYREGGRLLSVSAEGEQAGVVARVAELVLQASQVDRAA